MCVLLFCGAGDGTQELANGRQHFNMELKPGKSSFLESVGISVWWAVGCFSCNLLSRNLMTPKCTLCGVFMSIDRASREVKGIAVPADQQLFPPDRTIWCQRKTGAGQFSHQKQPFPHAQCSRRKSSKAM